MAKDMSQLESVEVAEMKSLKAKELLMKYLKLKKVSPEVEGEVDAVVRELGNLAPAIALAGSYVSATPRFSSDIRRYLYRGDYSLRTFQPAYWEPFSRQSCKY